MRKILQLLLSTCVLAQTTTTTISCFDGVESSWSSLPEGYGFEKGDTGEEVLNKIEKNFIEYNIDLTKEEYDVFLTRNSEKKLIQDDDILIVNDIIRIEVKNGKYLSYEFQIKEKRLKLEELKIDLNQSISVSALKNKIKSLLSARTTGTEYLVDYNIFLNDRDLEEYEEDTKILDGDVVGIKAISNSNKLVGENSYTVKLIIIDLSKLDIDILQGKSYENISKILTISLPNWSDETEISIIRDNSNVDFNEKYISLGKDKINIKAKENSLMYKGALDIIIKEKFYDKLFIDLGSFSGISLEDFKKTVVVKLNDAFSQNEIDFIIQETDIIFENEPKSFFEKETKVSFTVNYMGAKLFSDWQSTYIIGLEHFFFEPYQKWTNAKDCLDSLQSQLQAKYAVLDIAKDFEVFAIYNNEQVLLDSNFDPYKLDWKEIFSLKITAKNTSKYVVADFEENDIIMDITT